jgi:hypothetical protein
VKILQPDVWQQRSITFELKAVDPLSLQARRKALSRIHFPQRGDGAECLEKRGIGKGGR